MILFIAGPARSGTSALTGYLNQHPQMLICQERYKFVPSQIVPDFFTFDRILDFREGETNQPWEYYSKLLARKDPAKLEWIGDKTPGYVKHLKTLQKNNPEARYMILYRPIEEVVESYDARSRDPSDRWLTGENGFERGVRNWNRAMKRTRKFIEDSSRPNVLIVSYHDFFHRNDDFIPLLSRFLGLEFDESIRETWRQKSRWHETNRRRKESLSEEQLLYLAENKATAAEEWVLDRIERQWNAPETCFKEVAAPSPHDRPREHSRRVRADNVPEPPVAPGSEQLPQNLERPQDRRWRRQSENQPCEVEGSRISKLLRYLRRA